MEMRRKDRMISQEEINESLKNAEYGVLSSVSVDGIPYGTPVNFVHIENAIYFHSATEGHKLNNFAANPNVSFTVVDSVELMPARFSTKYRSVIAFGQVKLLEDDEERRAALKALLEKLTPDFMESGMKYIDSSIDKTKVYKMEITTISGKSNKG